MPVEEARQALTRAFTAAAHTTQEIAARQANVAGLAAELQAQVQLETAETQQESMAALQTAMNAFTTASHKGSQALTNATNRLVWATGALVVFTAVQALAILFGQ